jgi:hypothetical protein
MTIYSDRLAAVFALSGLLDGKSPEEREAAIQQVASVIREVRKVAAAPESELSDG